MDRGEGRRVAVSEQELGEQAQGRAVGRDRVRADPLAALLSEEGADLVAQVAGGLDLWYRLGAQGSVS